MPIQNHLTHGEKTKRSKNHWTLMYIQLFMQLHSKTRLAKGIYAQQALIGQGIFAQANLMLLHLELYICTYIKAKTTLHTRRQMM